MQNFCYVKRNNNSKIIERSKKKYDNCTHQLLNNLFDQFTERIVWIFTIQMIDEFGNDFGIGIRFKCMTLRLQIIFDIFVICNDAVVDNNKWMIIVRTLWMRIRFAWNTVRGPSCVRNANMCIQLEIGFSFTFVTGCKSMKYFLSVESTYKVQPKCSQLEKNTLFDGFFEYQNFARTFHQ